MMRGIRSDFFSRPGNNLWGQRESENDISLLSEIRFLSTPFVWSQKVYVYSLEKETKWCNNIVRRVEYRQVNNRMLVRNHSYAWRSKKCINEKYRRYRCSCWANRNENRRVEFRSRHVEFVRLMHLFPFICTQSMLLSVSDHATR